MHVHLRCDSLSIITPVSLLANEFDVRSVLHGQVSLAAANQVCVIHEARNGCKKYKDLLKDCFENVNIKTCSVGIKFFKHDQSSSVQRNRCFTLKKPFITELNAKMFSNNIYFCKNLEDYNNEH